MDPEQPQKKKIRIIAFSDTHDLHSKIKVQYLPEADIFIHAGDFTKYSRKKQLQRFRQFLKKLPYKHKVVIAGNHDFALDKEIYENKYKHTKHKESPLNSEEEIQKLKEVCIYLQHEMIEVEGIKIFGSPFSPEFFDWGFMYKEQQGKKLWSAIPENIDVLVTHGPPYGILDKTMNGINAGCKELLKRVETIKPKIHIFGHIHEGFGYREINGIKFYNASNVNFNYGFVNPETLIEIEKN